MLEHVLIVRDKLLNIVDTIIQPIKDYIDLRSQ